jgi:hypothetical protein
MPQIAKTIQSGASQRVISLCTESSTPSVAQLKEWSQLFANRVYPLHGASPVPVSLGLLFDGYVLDYLAVIGDKSDNFDLVDSLTIEDAFDLIDFGSPKSRRFNQSVYVLHVGDNPFFEWVVVPKIDLFMQPSSLTVLPPNEKLLFILKQFPLSASNMQRFRRLSTVFDTIADTFADIPTTWIFHFATGTPLKSSASLFHASASVRQAIESSYPLAGRSQLFQKKPDRSDDQSSNTPSQIGSPDFYMSEEQRIEARDTKELLEDLLDTADSSDGESSPIKQSRKRRREEREREEAEERDRLEAAARAKVEEKARKEKQRAEAEESARRQQEEARIERERQERDRLERERIEQEERDRQQREEQDRLAREEQERLQREEQERLAREEEERLAREEQERLAREQREEEERLERERREQEEREEKERLAREEEERLARERQRALEEE